MRVVVTSLARILECSPAAAGERLEHLCALLPPLRLRLGRGCLGVIRWCVGGI